MRFLEDPTGGDDTVVGVSGLGAVPVGIRVTIRTELQVRRSIEVGIVIGINTRFVLFARPNPV